MGSVLFAGEIHFCPAVNTTGNYRKKSPGSYFGRITGADYVCCLTSVVLPKT